jgi:hypothetical protein
MGYWHGNQVFNFITKPLRISFVSGMIDGKKGEFPGNGRDWT